MARRTRPLAAAIILVALALAGCGGSTARPVSQPAAATSPDRNDDAALLPTDPTPGAGQPASPTPSPSASRRPTAGPKPSRKPSPAPATGPASPAANLLTVYGFTFTLAGGGTGVVGPAGGTLKRYAVAVQTGLSESTGSVAATVDAILDNQVRGWAASGLWRFQRVSTGPYDFVVELATASATNTICGKYGIVTNGVVNCRGQQNVVINLTRWEQGTNGTTSGVLAYSPADYRVLAVNHEVGHALGHGHVGCPAAGAPAPAMMTQYFGVDGCLANIWPYATDGTYLTGPPA